MPTKLPVKRILSRGVNLFHLGGVILRIVLIFSLILNSYIFNLKSTFSATGDITSQNEFYKTTEEETGVRYKVDTGGTEPLFYKAADGVWRDRDSSLEDSTDSSFFKQAIKNQFHVFFQEKFNQGNLIRYKYDQEFQGKGKAQVDLTPQKLEWIEDGGNKHLIIDPPHNVTGTFSTNKATYTGAYGPGLDMEYEVTPSKLKKKLIIQTNTSLLAPTQQILNGTNPSLNLEARFQASNDVDIYIDNELWDKNTTKQTANKIEFKKEGQTIFSWSKPQYWDSDSTKDKQTSKYELKKSGGNLFVSIIVPYSWLSDPARTYPLFIDPTFEDSTARTITKTEELSNPTFDSDNSSWSVAAVPPSGWVEAPGNATLGTSNFLVMKYEAKCAADSDPTIGLTDPANTGTKTYYDGDTTCTSGNNRQVVSVTSGYPIAQITLTDSITRCSTVTLNGNATHLITNPEWMTIARNAEAQASNWTGGSLGSGYLFAGHNNTPFMARIASTTDTGNYACAYTDGNPGTESPSGSCPTNTASGQSGTSGNQKRVLALSNGSYIWDIAGNVREFVQVDASNTKVTKQENPEATTDGTNPVDDGVTFNWSDFASGGLSRYLLNNGTEPPFGYDVIRPLGSSYNGNQGVGRIYHMSNSSDTDRVWVFNRGGHWGDGADGHRAGAFALLLSDTSTSNTWYNGFRCASDPVAISQSFSSSSGRAGGGDTVTIGSVSDGKIYQSVNVGNSSTYNLSVYVYDSTAGNVGGTVTSSIAQLYYNGSTISTTYTDAGSGWWKLSGTLTGANASREYGVLVKVGKTVKVDDFSLNFYATSETVESSTLNSADANARWNTLAWTQTLPSGVGENSIRWRFGVKSADSGWGDSDFLGSDCTSSSFWTDTTSPFSVDLSSCSAFGTTGGRYGRYRLYFQTADRLVTPSVDTSTITYTILPIAPSGFSGAAGTSADANGTTRITWSWTDNASNESGFYVQDTSGNTKCTVSSANTTTCTETALTPTTSYTRRVVAYNSEGNSTASSNASATTRTVAAPTLDSPGGGAYTTSERPAFRFQTPTDNTSTKKYSDVSTYTLKVNDKDGKEIYNIPSISSSRTTADDRVRYKVSYTGFSDTDITNNYITVETKSSGEWTTSQNEGKIKSGKNTWEVCSVDERDNTACNSRTIYLDDGSPTLTDVTVSDSRTLEDPSTSSGLRYYVTTTTPTVTGTAKDGTALKELVILTEKANFFLGAITGYSAVHTTTLTLSGTSSDISHQIKDLSLGTYRITLTLKDTASNEVSTNLTLSIVTLDTLRELFNLPTEEITEKEAGTVDLSLESLAKTAKLRKQKEAEELKTALLHLQGIATLFHLEGVISNTTAFASTLTSTLKDAAVAFHLRGEEIRLHLEGVVNTVVAQFIARPITTAYTNLKNNAPDPIKIVLETQEKAIATVVSTTTQLSNKFDERLAIASDKKPKLAGEDVREAALALAHTTRNLIIFPVVNFDNVFNKEPPEITNVTVEEVGRDYAVVSWDTNHWSWGKVNYGEKEGQWSNNVLSSQRRKHHKVSISNLSVSTRYFFEIVSHNGGSIFDAYYYFDTPKK